MITKEDIQPVAKDLNFIPTEEEIQEIIDGYELESEEDPTGNLPIWIENLLYSVDVKKMDTIKCNGKTYPTRTFEVNLNDQGMNITISTVSLEKALGVEQGKNEDVDNDIYFYVEDEQIFLTAKEICEKHLDEPMVFVAEQ